MKEVCRVNMMSHEISVCEVDPDIISDGMMGRASIKDQKILIASDMGEDVKNHTFLHELVHLASDILCLEFTEQQVDGISLAFHSLLKDNDSIKYPKAG